MKAHVSGVTEQNERDRRPLQGVTEICLLAKGLSLMQIEDLPSPPCQNRGGPEPKS